MNRTMIVGVVVVVAASGAYAQSADPPISDAPANSDETAPPLAPETPAVVTSAHVATCPDGTVLPQPGDECAQDSRWVRAGRIGLETVMGVGLGAVPIVTGAYVGLSIDLASGKEAGAGLDIGAAIGASIGVGSSVFLAGHLMNGDGAYGWTVLGSTAGTGLAAGLLAIKSTTTTLVFAAMLPVAGAIVGYELSSHRRRARKLTATIAPAIGPSTFGVAGTF